MQGIVTWIFTPRKLHVKTVAYANTLTTKNTYFYTPHSSNARLSTPNTRLASRMQNTGEQNNRINALYLISANFRNVPFSIALHTHFRCHRMQKITLI